MRSRECSLYLCYPSLLPNYGLVGAQYLIHTASGYEFDVFTISLAIETSY